ncbi:MAG: tetratricopeptide repeat protein, partial [Pirellula sp.]|nr:tetratricopeptide repeat protein [Pirellula sp.]
KKKEALDAAKQLIIAAPSKTENYEFYAQTCFRLGEFDEGMQALRKAIRISPNEPALMMALGTALADQMRIDEAIELYWRAYEKSDDLTDKTAMVTKLANLYLQVNQLEKLIERLERERQDEDNRRSATICIAQAWQTAGDVSEARKELEGLLGENTKDTNLLSQLAKLCQADADMDSAINYQRQLVRLAPGDETESPLASMLISVGEIEEAKAIYTKLIEAEEDPVRQLRSLDSLLNSGNYDTALRVMEPLLDKQRDDWELLYRYGVCWANLKNSSEAKTRFERILSLTIPHETLGRAAQAKLKQSQEKARSDNLRGIATAMPVRESALQMTQQVNAVQNAVGLRADEYSSSPTPAVWTPPSYGLARMAALGWLLRMEREVGDEQNVADSDSESREASDTFADSVRKRGVAEGATQRDLLDWLYLSLLKGEYPDVLTISRQLAKSGGIEEKRFFLQSLRTREASESQARRSGSDSKTTQKPLDESDLAFMQSCFDDVSATQKDMNLEAMYGPNLAYDSNGQAYILVGSSYQALPGVFRNNLGFRSLLMSEYRAAGKLDRVNELIQKQIDAAKTSSEWIAVLSVLRDEKRFSEMPDALEKWKAAAAKEIAEKPVVSVNSRVRNQQNQSMPLVSALNVLQQWIGQLGSEEENDRILQLLDDVLPIAVAEGKYRVKAAAVTKTVPMAAVNTTQSSSAFGLRTYYGQQTNEVNLTFPPMSTEIDGAAITILRQFFDVLNKNGVSQDMVNRLQQRSIQATDDSLYWNWYLASVLWWSDDQDAAMEIVNKVMAESANEPRTQLRWAALMESREEFEEALAIIERVSPRDQNQLVRRETTALRLAERIGDTDRARQAAERLFGLRLTSDAQLQLLPQLRRLGLDAQADALLARMERTAARQPSTLSSMMNLYQSQGKTEKANQAALAILRQTTSPYAASQSNNRQSPRYQTANNRSSERSAALVQLSTSGVLAKMTEALKEKLAKSPDSVYTLEQLIEYSKALNQNDQADEYLAQAIALRPGSHILRWNLATNLMGRGKHSEACDQYLILLDSQPNWISEQFYEISRSFSQAKRQKEFIAKVQTIDLKRFRSPWQLINLIENTISQEPDSLESFLPLIERVFDADSSNRSYFISNLLNRRGLEKNERVYQLIKRSVIPDSKAMAFAAPWAGLDNMISYNPEEGRVTVVFSNLLDWLKSDSSRSADLKKTIDEGIQQQPKWLAGPAMLALIDMTGADAEEGRKRLEAMLQDEELWNDMPSTTCWYLGQQLVAFPQSEELAIKLFKNAEMKLSSGQLQSSPISALVKFAKKRPELRPYIKERIDQRLQEQKNGSAPLYDPEYAAYQRIQQSMSTSDLFNAIEYPIDAYLAVKPIERDPNLESASRYYGNVDSLKSNLQLKITTAQNSITDQSLMDSLERLLPEKQRIDLMMTYPSLKGPAGQIVTSGLLDILRYASKQPETKQVIMDRLTKLVEQQPSDLSAGLVRALWMMEQDCEGELLVPELTRLLELAKLEPIAEGRRPNNRQRLEAKSICDLWLVAREILSGESSNDAKPALEGPGNSSTESAAINDPPVKARPFASHSECVRLANQLADLAVEASLRQSTLDDQVAVLMEIADLRTREKDWELAEGSWERLLSIATKSSTKRSDNTTTESSSTSSKPTLDPPLTISQFRLAMKVCSSALAHGRSNTATKALAMSLRGGMPVPDSEAAPPVPSSRAIIMSRANNAPVKDPIESEVQDLLTATFASWGDSSNTPAELFDALRLIVLPPNRPDQIRLYVNVSAVEDGREESIASSLVRAAAKAGKLDELKSEVEGRAVKANSLPSQKSLLALIAMESGDLPKSKELMNELAQQIEKQSSEATIPIAALAAVRAFSYPELQPSAASILNPLMRSLLTKRNNSNEDLYSLEARNQSLLPDFALQLSRYFIAQGEESRAREYFETALQARSQMYARYSGSDYVRVLQRTDLGNLAKNAVRIGMDAYTWELLGRFADIPDSRAYAASGNATNLPLEYLIRLNRNRTAEERYQAWFEWTMPNSQRSSVRVVYAEVRAQDVPTYVVQSTERGRVLGKHSLSSGMVSNLSELVIAASECNQLESLKQQVEAFDSYAASAAPLFLDLIHICQKNDAEVQKRVSDRLDRHYA